RQVTELKALGHLVPGQALAREVGQRARVDVFGFPERHEGHGHLSPALVRYPDDGAFHHRRMTVQHTFHLNGGDVLPAGDDDVLAPVADLNVAVRVLHRQVAGQEAAAAGDLPGGLVVPVVAEHDVVAADRDLADRL